MEATVQRLATDFRFFFETLWNDRGLYRRHKLTDIEFDIADWIADGDKTRGVLAPRGFGKTHFVMPFCLWRLLQDPDHKIIVVSKSETHAKKVVKTMRDWIGACWFLQHLQPSEDQTDSATQFQVGPAAFSVQPSITAIGIGGQLEGNRAHTIIADDVETAKNSATLTARQDLDERVKEFKDILFVDLMDEAGAVTKRSEIIYVGTYHHEDSLYLKLAERGYKFRTWPIVYPSPGEETLGLAPIVAAKLRADPGLADQPAMVHRFNATNIAEKRAEGFTRFAMQHKLISNLRATNMFPLKLDDLIVMDVDPRVAPIYVGYGRTDNNGSTALEDIPTLGISSEKLHRPFTQDKNVMPYTGTRAFVDPAGRGTDETGACAMGHLSGLFYVKGLAGFVGGADPECLDRIALFLRLHNVSVAYYESNIDTFDTYGPALALAVKKRWLEPGQDPLYPDGWKCSVLPIHSTGQKEIRIIETLEPVMSTHRLVVDRKAIAPVDGLGLEYQLQYQISRITKERKSLPHDDRVDALAGAVRLWLHETAIDPITSSAKKAEQIREQIVRARSQRAMRPARAPRWAGNSRDHWQG